MKTLFVVNRESDWPQELQAAAVASAKAYLTGAGFNNGQYDRVVNLCRCDRAQGPGFYVSLLAEARGHQPLPAAKTLEDLRASAGNAPVLTELARLAQETLPQQGGPDLVVHSYFGADPSATHDALCQQIFALLRVPLLRVEFRYRQGQWRVARVRPLALIDLPAEHRPGFVRSAKQFLADAPRARAAVRRRPAIAILHTPGEPLPPSNPQALDNFLRAAHGLGMRAEIIDRRAIDRLEEFDALFIRDTTYLNHYTYQFSQRAAALGLVVIDRRGLDPPVQQQGVPQRAARPARRAAAQDAGGAPGQPRRHRRGARPAVHPQAARRRLFARRAQGRDAARAQAQGARNARVLRAHHRAGIRAHRLRLARRGPGSPAAFRVPLFHGAGALAGPQIRARLPPRRAHRGRLGRRSAASGGAHRAARRNLVGNGLYGVDLKQLGERCVVMEINDNPSIEAGNEDGLLKDALYREVMGVFLRRIGERQQALAA